MKQKKNKILVTVASGMIGSHLVDKLVEDGNDVYGICRVKRWANPKVKYFCCDLKNATKTNEIIQKISPEYIYHLAANAAQSKGQNSPINMSENNYNLFFNVITPAIKTGNLKRFVYSSTMAVYGSIDSPYHESDNPQPVDIYGIAKRAIEQSLQVLAKVHNFEYVITRLHNVTGTRQDMNDPYRNVVTIFMTHLMRNQQYKIFGNGEVTRQFSNVKDVTDVLSKCMRGDVPNTIFNVGSDKAISLKKLSDVVQEITGIYLEPKLEPLRSQEIFNVVGDHTLCKNIFGYNETDIKDYLREVWDYVKNIGPIPLNYEKFEIVKE